MGKSKNFLFFLVHPAKYHAFKNTINKLIFHGHEVKVLTSSKDVLVNLVSTENWDHECLFPEGRKMKNLPTFLSAVLMGLLTILRLFRATSKKRYDLYFTDDLLTFVGKIQDVPTLHFQDDDLAAVPELASIIEFADYVISPECSNMGKYEAKKLGINSYKELGGFHPDVFLADKKVVENKIKSQDFFLIRLVSLKATHDVNKEGLTNSDVLEIIKFLRPYGEVYINSEREIDPKLEPFRLSISPEQMCHFLGHCKIFISDSQTMSAEAAVLGTPFIRINDFVDKLSYLHELENKYHLGYGIRTNEKDKIFTILKKLVANENLDELWANRRKKMLMEKDNLNTILIDILENYPDTLQNYQNTYVKSF